MLRNVLLAGIFAIPFIPFFVSGSMFFPFITGKNFAFRIIIEILFAGWLILLFNHPEYRPRFNKLTIAVLSLLGILTLATVFGENPYRSFWSNFERMEGLVTFIHLTAYFLVASSILSTEKLWRRFFQTSLVASVGMVVYVLLQVWGGATINQGGVRVDATLGNATYLAVYALFHIFFAVYFLIVTREYRQKWVYGLIGFGNLFVLYKTGTRGTMLGLVAGVIMAALLLLWQGIGNQKKVAAILLGLVGVLGALFLGFKDTPFIQSNQILSRFAAISWQDFTDESRYFIWQMSWQGLKEHPLLGWGPENYNLVFDKYYHPALWGKEPWFDRSHNVFFDWLINAGVFGLAAYLSLFGLALYYVWRSKEDLVIKSLITGFLVGYFVHNIFVFDNLISYIFFFSILAWASAVYAKDEVIELKPVKRIAPVGTNQPLFFGLVVLVLVGVIYFFNWRPIMASRQLILGLVSDPAGPESLTHFKQALALDTFASGEVREQLLQASLRAANNVDTSAELKTEWLQFADTQMKLAVAGGQQNDARSNMLYGGFLAQLGVIDVGFYDQAIERFEVARQFSPKKQAILLQEGNVYMLKGNKVKALELAKLAFDLDPSYPDARRNYLVTAIDAGREDLAKELVAGSDDPNILFDRQLINLYVARSQFGKVLEIWQKQVELDPTNTQNRISLAGAYVKVGKRAEAIRVLRDTVGLNADPEFKKQIDLAIAEIELGRDPFNK